MPGAHVRRRDTPGALVRAARRTALTFREGATLLLKVATASSFWVVGMITMVLGLSFLYVWDLASGGEVEYSLLWTYLLPWHVAVSLAEAALERWKSAPGP